MGPGRHVGPHRNNTVVSVSETSSFLLSDARSTLQRALDRRPQSDPVVLFAYWLLERKTDEAEARQVAAAAAQRSGAQQDFHTVAAVGFARASGLLGAEVSGTLKQGLERLAGRQPFVDGNWMPFCSDAVGILGVALGSRVLGDSALSAKIATWLSGFLAKIYELDGTEDSQRILFQAANHVMNGNIQLPPAAQGQASDIAVALRSKSVLPQGDGERAEQDEEQALRAILSGAATEPSYERAAIKLAALEHVIRSAPTVVPGRFSAQDLAGLLHRIPAGLRKWTWETSSRTANAPLRRWHIDNEYHVQNLLWATLAPIFPDLDDEQYLVKIGQKSPRADLHIPSMKIIIEAKFIRPGDSMQKVIDEISSDTGLYGAMGNDCTGIIAAIWDNSARSHEHDYLRQGLRKLPMILDAIVVSRPGWIEDETESPSKAKGKKGQKPSKS
jgi:REase_DpnII-MboI